MAYDSEAIASYVNNLIIGLCHFQVSGGRLTPLFISDGCHRMLRYSPKETLLFLSHLHQNVLPEDLPLLNQAIDDILQDNGSVEVEFRAVTLTGGLCWLELRGNVFMLAKDRAEIICALTDITERKQMEEEMARQAERLNLVIQTEQQIILDYNAKTDVLILRRIEQGNLPQEELVANFLQKFDGSLYNEEDVEKILEVYAGLLKREGKDSMEYRSNRYSQEQRWYQAVLSSITDNNGYVTRIVGRIMDIHEKKLKELELTRKAEKDALSGLYNKGASKEHIVKAIESSSKDSLHALMLVDLDNFKGVNDNFGHAEGDKLIRKVADTLQDIFKGADIIGRTGGDEFIVLARDIENIANADILAGKLVKAIHTVYPLHGGTLEVSSSVGVSIYPYHGQTYQELFDKADQAMYVVKGAGKNSYRIYEATATKIVYVGQRNEKRDKYINLNGKLEMDELVLDVLHEEKDKKSALKTVLELICNHFSWQRAYARLEDVGSETDYTLYYASDGEENRKESLEVARVRKRAYREFRHSKCLRIMDVKDPSMTGGMREYMLREGVESIAYFPFLINQDVRGGVIFEKREYGEGLTAAGNEAELFQFRSLMRIMAAYMQPQGFIRKLAGITAKVKLLDNMDSCNYLVDYETGAVVLVNKKVMETDPDFPIGNHCNLLFGEELPSPVQRLDRQDPASKFSQKIYHEKWGGWCHLAGYWLECGRGMAIAVLSLVDLQPYLGSEAKQG